MIGVLMVKTRLYAFHIRDIAELKKGILMIIFDFYFFYFLNLILNFNFFLNKQSVLLFVNLFRS